MPDWAVVLLGAGIGSAVTLLTLWLTMRHAERERERSERVRRRNQGTAVLGPIQLLLSQADPAAILHFLPRDRAARFGAELSKRWQGLQEPLLIFSTAHPSPDVREFAKRLATAVTFSIESTRQAIRATGESEAGLRQQARAHYREANEFARELLRLIHEDAGERPSPSGSLRGSIARLRLGRRPWPTRWSRSRLRRG